MKASFDLIDEPWLPCVDASGRAVHVGLRRALVEAHALTGLRGDSPLATAALLRLLLAVLHSALDGPEDRREWRALWTAGRWPERKLNRYVEERRDRFDLFHPKHPFMQVGGFEIEGGKTSPVTKLAHEWATGNNATLFDHGFEERPRSLSPAQAARQLVTAQAFALGGGVGATSKQYGQHPNLTHGPLVGGVSVLLEGSTLFETLALNLLDRDHAPPGKQDAPTWERAPVAPPGPRSPAGYREFLTWRARFVRLVPEAAGSETIVREMHYTQGWKVDGPFKNPAWSYVEDEKRGALPVALREDRALWRDSAALLAAGDERDKGRPRAIAQAVGLCNARILERERALRCLAIGLCNDKAKPLLWREERIGVPIGLLGDEEAGALLVKGLQLAEEAGSALASAIGRFRAALKDAVPEASERAARTFWSALDPEFQRFVAQLAVSAPDPLRAWIGVLENAARDAYDRGTENALRRAGRELEARVSGRSLLERKLAHLTEPEEVNTDATN